MKRFVLRASLAVFVVSTTYGVLWFTQLEPDPMATVVVSRDWVNQIFDEFAARLAERDARIAERDARIAELEQMLLNEGKLERRM